MSELLTRRRFTVAELDIMDAAGIFDGDGRIELIDGEIIEMNPIGGPHMWCVAKLNEALAGVVTRPFLVSVQGPIELGPRDMPEPDIAVVRPPTSGSARPGPDATALVIEVADSSRRIDRTTKMRRYGVAGIPEAWLVDLVSETVERFTDAGPAGYRLIAVAGRGESIGSTTVPDFTLDVDVILG